RSSWARTDCSRGLVVLMILGVDIFFGLTGACAFSRPGHYWLVGWMAVKPLRNGAGLLAGAADCVDLRQKILGIGQVGQIPAYMLAGRTDSGELAIKLVMVFQVVQQAVTQFAVGGRRQVAAVGQ